MERLIANLRVILVPVSNCCCKLTYGGLHERHFIVIYRQVPLVFMVH